MVDLSAQKNEEIASHEEDPETRQEDGSKWHQQEGADTYDRSYKLEWIISQLHHD